MIILGAADPENQKVYLVSCVAEDIIKQKGINAGDLVKILGKKLGGGGGGQPHIATAGGHQPEKLGGVLLDAKDLVIEHLDNKAE